MVIALDTNVLVYGAALGDGRRAAIAARLLKATRSADVIIPMKVLAEFYGVLVGTAKWPVEEAAAEVRRLRLTFPTAETLATTFASALALAGRHAFQIFDAIILTAAAEAHCALLLFEDMQHGFEWQGVTIVNPSEPEPHPLIVAAIGIPTRIIAKEPRPCPS